MKFRYVPFTHYCLLFVAIMIGLGLARRAINSSNLATAASLWSMTTLQQKTGFAVVSLVLIFLAILIFARFWKKIRSLFPSRCVTLNKDGIAFDLPLQISGFVDWRNVTSVSRTAPIRGIWAITIEFNHKLLIGPVGAERGLERLILRGNQIRPSGQKLFDMAQRYHAEAANQ